MHSVACLDVSLLNNWINFLSLFHPLLQMVSFTVAKFHRCCCSLGVDSACALSKHASLLDDSSRALLVRYGLPVASGSSLLAATFWRTLLPLPLSPNPIRKVKSRNSWRAKFIWLHRRASTSSHLNYKHTLRLLSNFLDRAQARCLILLTSDAFNQEKPLEWWTPKVCLLSTTWP